MQCSSDKPDVNVEEPIELGVTSIEYGLLATGVALLASAGVFGLGPKVLAIFESIAT